MIRFSNGQFNDNGICWYLDSSFCQGFHVLKQRYGAENVLTTAKVIMFLVWGFAIAAATYQLTSFIRG